MFFRKVEEYSFDEYSETELFPTNDSSLSTDCAETGLVSTNASSLSVKNNEYFSPVHYILFVCLVLKVI